MTPHLWETCERVSGCDYSPLKAALEKLTIPDVWQMLGLPGKPAKVVSLAIPRRAQCVLLNLRRKAGAGRTHHRATRRRR